MTFIPSSITFWPARRDVVDGHHPLSSYAEVFWLPRLGPTAAWCHRRLTALLEQHPEGVVHDTEDLAAQLGVGPKALMRTLDRLCDLGLATWKPGSRTHISVRTQVPTLNERQLARLPQSLRAAHAQVAVADEGVRGLPLCRICRTAPVVVLEPGRNGGICSACAMEMLTADDAEVAVAP